MVTFFFKVIGSASPPITSKRSLKFLRKPLGSALSIYKKSYGLSRVAYSNIFRNCSGLYWLLHVSANSLIIFSDLQGNSIMTLELRRMLRGHNLYACTKFRTDIL